MAGEALALPSPTGEGLALSLPTMGTGPPDTAPTTSTIASYTLNKQKLVSNLQARASSDGPLLTMEAKDGGKSVSILCMAALFSSTVRPALSPFSKGYTRTIDGTTISLPKPPHLMRDQGGATTCQ